MTALPRRLVVGATTAALLAGVVGFVPLLGSASAADCPAWTDPKGDSIAHDPVMGEADPSGFFTDSNLDVVASTFGTVGDSLVATVTTDGLLENSSDTGDEFGFDFTVAGVALNFYADRTVFQGAAILDDAGVLGPNASGAATATYDVAKKTVTITAKLTEVAKAAEKPVTGQAVSALSSYTKDQVPLVPLGFGQPLIEYDRSATTLTTTLGVECGGGSSTPAPTGTGTPTETPPPAPTPAPPADGLFEQPRKGCVTFKDATGDADPTGIGEFNEGSLDVTQVNLKSPGGTLQVYVGLVNPAEALLDLWSGRIYTVTTTVGGKAVALTAPGEGAATATVGGVANTDIKATVKVDAKNKNLVFTVPLEGLAKATGTAIAAGTAFTVTSVVTKADSELGAQEADTASGTTPAEKTYAYGDNGCFMPPAGILTIEADASGQHGDRTELFATLTDADEAPVQGVTVKAVLTGGKAVSAVTDADGLADLFVPLKLAAGTRTLTISFAGNAEVGAVKATRPFKVVAEKTVLKALAVKGGVKATVLDDDKHPVVGRPVTFTIGSKKRVVKTNAKGVAVLTGVAKGTAVKVVFLPVKGYYLGTPTRTVKAL